MDKKPKASLTETFKKANHIRHNIMDASMLLMAVGAAVLAAGPMVAVFDPITPFLKMHFEGFLMAFDTLPDFASNAWDNVSNGTWLSGVDVGSAHAMHGGVGAAHGTAAGALTPCDQWLSALSPDELSGIQGDLKSTYGGMSLCQYHDMNIMHHGVK